MKAMKKLLSIMLVALLLVSAVPFQASAMEIVDIGIDYTIVIDGYSFAVRDGNGVVTAEELYNELELSKGEDATIDAWIASVVAAGVKDGDVLTVPTAGGSEGGSEGGNNENTGNNQNNGNQGGEGQPIVGGGESQPEQVVTKCSLTIDYKLSDTPVNTVNAQIGKTYSQFVGVPARGGYDFLGWYSDYYGRIIDVTKDILMGDDTITGLWSAAKEFFLTLDENRNGEEYVNYGVKVAYGENIYAKVSKYKPEREGYVFMGWKLNGKMITEKTVYELFDDATAYAQWKLESDTEDEPMNGTHTKDGKVYLEIYVNGDTSAAEKKVDITSYAADNKITQAEVETVVKKYVTPKSGYKLAYEGLFDEETWWWYTRDPETNGKASIVVNQDGDDYIYVMVKNVKVVAADPSNPKTGDGIVIALATMMSTGGAALALGKKKFF